MPHESPGNIRRSLPLLVLALSGLLGFIIGIARFQTWQVVVETAQVLAGLVQYPADNPFYIYHSKLWTVMHQICALLLRSGVSEITLSQLVSGLLGMVSFQALSMLVYAFSKDTLVAIGAPVLILYARAAEHGASYPIALMGTDHTYGVLGLSTVVLVVGLLGAGCYRSGGFLLGVAPAVHPALGLWIALVVTGGFVWDFKRLRMECRPWLPYFAAGCAVTALSLLVHLTMAHDVPAVEASVSSQYLSAFVDAWDDHRRPASIVSVGTILNLSVLVVGWMWLTAFVNDLPRPAVFALRVMVVSAVLSLSLIFVSWLPPRAVPSALLILMPSRFLNFNVLAFVPLVVGLLGVHRRSVWCQLVTAALLCGLFLSYRSMLWDAFPATSWLAREIQFNPWHVFVAMSLALLGVRATPAWKQAWRPAAAVARSLSLGVVLAAALLTWRLPRPYPLLDRTNDPFFAAVSAEPRGLVLTAGSFHLVQLYTRRPVLLDGGALDTVTYAPEGGPAVARILRDVYDIDFFNPPAEARRSSAIPHRLNKPVWERYSRLKWQEIGWAFNVTQVVTRADWSLDLPIAAENRSFKLYRIPN